MASVASVNLIMGCEDCKFADAFGRSCEHGVMFPVLAMMAGYKECPNFEKKTLRQLQERYDLTHTQTNEKE